MDGNLRLTNPQQTTEASFTKIELPTEKKKDKSKKNSKTENAAQTALNSSSNSASSSTSSMQTRTVKVPAGQMPKPSLTGQVASSSSQSSKQITENKPNLEISETKSSENIAIGDALENTVVVPESLSFSSMSTTSAITKGIITGNVVKESKSTLSSSQASPSAMTIGTDDYEDSDEYDPLGLETRLSLFSESLWSSNITLLKLDQNVFADYLANGSEQSYGIPLHPTVAQNIMSTIYKAMIDGRCPDGSTIEVGLNNNKLNFKIKKPTCYCSIQ